LLLFYIAGDSFVAAHNYAFRMTYALYREDWEAGAWWWLLTGQSISSSSQGQGQWFDFLATTVFLQFYLPHTHSIRHFFKGLLVVA